MRWFLVLAIMVSSAQGSVADDRPNIVVFYTDDHGHADLSCQGVFDDVRTPHVDALAASGARALHGYSTAPQCVPSRAGLLIGKFQSRFGVESNGASLDGFDRELTIAERLKASGYVTAQFGKWHLGPANRIPTHGFRYVFAQNAQRPFAANIDLAGMDRPMGNLPPERYHVDACSEAAASLIHRFHDQPMFLYVAYRAPHVPLDAPRKYLDRFPGKMPERRRQALAMLSAVDDGVGRVMSALEKNKLLKKTLVFYIGDNGAPLKIHKTDAPGGGPGWDGSLNDPLNGEKGMLTEGGMHTPFVVSWPGTITAGQQYPHPISALDVAATAVSIAGASVDPEDLDGVNLIPYLSGKNTAAPHEALMWRWLAQSAVREGKWKLLRGGDREYLFDLDADIEEKHDLKKKHPEIADRLRRRLQSWASELSPPGLSTGGLGGAWGKYYDFYLDGKPAPPPAKAAAKSGASSDRYGRWIVRGGTASKSGDAVKIEGRGKTKSAFITRNGVKLRGPIEAKIVLKTKATGPVLIAWRTAKEKDFVAKNRFSIAVDDASSESEWKTFRGTLPVDSSVVHVRVHLPKGVATIKSLELKPAKGKTLTLEN